MKIIAVALGLCLALVTSALAAPTSSQLQLVDRYIKASHMADNIIASVNAMRPMFMADATKKLTPEQLKAFDDAFDAAYQHFVDRYFVRIKPLLADTYSERELTEIVSFLESPAGQSMTTKSPMLSQKLAPIVSEMLPDLQADLLSEFCAGTECETGEPKVHSQGARTPTG